MTPRLPRPRPLTLSLLGLALVTLLALEIAGWPFLRAPLERKASQLLNREVRLDGDFRLRIIGNLRLRAGRLRLAAAAWERNPAGAAAPPLLEASNVTLVLTYGALLDQLRASAAPLRIRRLEVNGIELRLRRLTDGRANWDTGGARTGGTPRTPEFVHLVVHKGQLTLQDARRDLALSAQVRTREGSARDAAGLYVRAGGQYRGQGFTVEVRSPGLLPLLAPAGKGAPVALAVNARLRHPGRRDSQVSFRGRARDLLRFDGLVGRFRIAGPSLGETGRMMKVTLPSTAPFYLQGEAEKNSGNWGIRVNRFEVGETRLNGRFRYREDLARPLLSGELQGEQLRLRDLAPAFGASPAPPGADAGAESADHGEAVSRRVLPQHEFDLPSLHRMDADVTVGINRVDLGSRSLEPLHPLSGRLSLHDGVLRLEQLLARTAQGRLQGELGIDARDESPRWTADLRWSGIDLSDWVRARNRFAQPAATGSAETRDEEASPGERRTPHFLTGELAGELHVTGNGRSTAAMLASLDGRLYLWIRNGTVSHLLLEAAGLDIAESLGLILRGDRNLPLRCAAMSLRAENGVLRTEAGVVDTSDTLVLLDGKVSLAEERFALRLQARPHDRSLLSIRAPLQLRGSFANPKVRPDMEKLGGKAALAAVFGALLSPLAALVPLVDPGEGSTARGCGATLARLREKPGTPTAMKRALRGQQ